MPQYHIHILEKRRDWPMIVTSVECPPPQQGGCGAGKGEFCKQISTSLGSMGQQSQRIDFHAARKYAAANFLEENPMPDMRATPEEARGMVDALKKTYELMDASRMNLGFTEVSGTPVVHPDPLHEISEGRVPEHIKEMRTPPEFKHSTGPSIQDLAAPPIEQIEENVRTLGKKRKKIPTSDLNQV